MAIVNKVKLYNRNKFDVGVKFINPVREQNVKAGSFTIVDEDDVYYLNTTCNILKRGMLVCDNEEVNINLGSLDSIVLKSDNEIETLLKGNFLKMKSELSKIKEKFMIDCVFTVAQKMVNELSGGKIKHLNDYCGRNVID